MSTRVPSTCASMRKAPLQARSRETVEVIIRAGARVLGELGWSGFTTNKVAEAAGVSIGSVYQYFPDKLALIDSIRHRHLDDVLTVMRGMEQAKPSANELVEHLVRGLIAAHSIEPKLHRVLLDEVPGDASARSAHEAFASEYLKHYRLMVALICSKQKADDDLVILVLSSAVEGAIHGAARRGKLGSADFKRELAAMIHAYLSCQAAGGGGG